MITHIVPSPLQGGDEAVKLPPEIGASSWQSFFWDRAQRSYSFGKLDQDDLSASCWLTLTQILTLIWLV